MGSNVREMMSHGEQQVVERFTSHCTFCLKTLVAGSILALLMEETGDLLEYKSGSQGASTIEEIPQGSQGASTIEEIPQGSQGASTIEEIPQGSQGASTGLK
ncbi:hypothetical protein RRG08_049386 [Elysia crispata]|uniref:Uncharacterized protein n=1 Tax=Elysia crispata TaxID=231223 RepID=A0AAE1CEW6_9GAST|nr:hypothetical protein RRG08_049386 [Elysia crispata]